MTSTKVSRAGQWPLHACHCCRSTLPFLPGPRPAWSRNETDGSCQTDGASCGIFVAEAARCYAMQERPIFSQEDVPVLRTSMAVSLLTGELQDPRTLPHMAKFCDGNSIERMVRNVHNNLL